MSAATSTEASSLIGYEEILDAAIEHRVVLIVGPKGVGKRAACMELARRCGAAKAEQRVIDRLDMETARAVVTRCRTRPLRGVRAFVVNAQAVSAAAANALLKTLEEGHEANRFYLHSSAPVLPTIVSRSAVFRKGVLSDDEVYRVCRAHGMSDDEAYVATRAAKGIPAAALRAHEDMENRHVVSELLRAVAEGDSDLLSASTASLDPEGMRLLRTWAHEASTGRWAVFAPGESHALEDNRAFVARVRKITDHSGSPRLVSRAALWLATEKAAGRA